MVFIQLVPVFFATVFLATVPVFFATVLAGVFCNSPPCLFFLQPLAGSSGGSRSYGIVQVFGGW